jgi:hypothetical protein
MFKGGHNRSFEGRRLKAWAAEMNAAVAREYPYLCDKQMDCVLEIGKSRRGGEGIFVRAGHCVPQYTVLGCYPGTIGGRVAEDDVRQMYVVGLPVFKAEPGGPDIMLDLNGRPEGGPPFGVEDASMYNNVCGDQKGTMRMFWHSLGPGKPQIMMAQAARDLVGGDELVWAYGREYSLENMQGLAANARKPGSVVRCKCAAPRRCPFQRWMRQ